MQTTLTTAREHSSKLVLHFGDAGFGLVDHLSQKWSLLHVTTLRSLDYLFRLIRMKAIGYFWALTTVLLAVEAASLTARGAEALSLQAAQAGAEKGDPVALYDLGKRYSKGDGVLQDYAKAAECWRQSAEKGHAFAQNNLAVLYAKGLGVPQDHELAAKWYRKAAEAGDALAQNSMGRVCFLGRGVTQDIPQALAWYRKAAAQKQPDAELALGEVYFKGADGLPMDYRAAIKWFERAVKHGRVDALCSLGLIYEQGGRGTKQDAKRAVGCFREAAQRGDARGQMNLGRVHRDGHGVKTDVVEAYKWFIVASENGDHVAKHYMDEMDGANAAGAKLLTPSQTEEARQRAMEFLTQSNPSNASKKR
jgi:TPR repeat protein